MNHPSAEDQLRTQVRATLAASRVSQAEASRRLGLSTKHVNQMLMARATLTLSWAERLVELCGARVLAIVTVPPGPLDRVPRIRLDDLTDDLLDGLYAELDRAHEVIGELSEANVRLAQRAARRTK